MTVSFSHVGVGVSDLAPSVRFSVDGLGLEAAESWTGNPKLDFVCRTDPDGTRIELMCLPG